MKTWPALIIFVLVMIACIVLGLHAGLSLASLKASLNGLIRIRDENPFGFAAAFLLTYVAAGALSMPFVALLTLAGGALFGLIEGTILVSFGSSIGATLAFLASRYLWRDKLLTRFGDSLRVMNAGMERDGAFYLFSLRLIPLFPYFIINLVMGLTPIRTRTFYGVSQIGMLAVTLVYVNAGTQLAKIDSLSAIMSPPLMGSLVLLGLFPWVARLTVVMWQKLRHIKQ